MIQKLISKIKIDKSFIKSSTLVFIGSLIVSIFNYLFRTFSGRFLGPTDYGIVSFLISIVSLFTVFSVSIDTALTKFSSEKIAQKKPGQIISAYKILSRYAFVVGLLIFLIIFLCANFIAEKFKVDALYIKMIGTVFMFIFTNNVAKGVIRGNKDFKQFTTINVIESASKLILFFSLFRFGLRIESSVFALIGAVICSFLYSGIVVKRYLKKKAEKIKLKNILAYFSGTFVALGFFSLLTFIDIPLAKYFLNEYDAGVYAALSDIGKILFYAITPIILVMFPMISEMHSKGKKHYQILIQTIGLIILLGLPALLIYKLFPEKVINILYGQQYVSAANQLAKIGFAMFILVFCNMFAQYFLSIKKVKFWWAILSTLFFEIILFYFFNNSIDDLVNNLVYSFCFLFLLFVGYYIYNKKERIKQLYIENISID